MRPHRWLLISSQHQPSHGGIGTYVTRFAHAATEVGWHVELLTRKGPHHPPGVKVHEVETPDEHESFARRLPALRRMERVRPYRYALWSRAAANRLMELNGQFDAVEFVDCQAEGFASLGSHALRRRFSTTPMIVHAHTPMFVEEQINGSDMLRFGRRIYHDWERRSLQKADGVITTSRLLASRLPLLHGVCVIPYPIAPMASSLSPPTRTFNHCNETILLVGSVQPRKGVMIWARSLNRVLRNRPAARAVLIGPDTPTAPAGGSMAAHVTAMINADLRERFQFAGPLPHPVIQRMIGNAGLVVVPSLFESFSFVAAEALTLGTPLIVSDQVGLIEHVPGLATVPADDVESLAEAQLRILSDPATARQQAIPLRQRMFEACSPRRHLHMRLAFVESLKAASTSSAAASTNPSDDVISEINEFINAVEREERISPEVSSAVS